MGEIMIAPTTVESLEDVVTVAHVWRSDDPVSMTNPDRDKVDIEPVYGIYDDVRDRVEIRYNGQSVYASNFLDVVELFEQAPLEMNERVTAGHVRNKIRDSLVVQGDTMERLRDEFSSWYDVQTTADV